MIYNYSFYICLFILLFLIIYIFLLFIYLFMFCIKYTYIDTTGENPILHKTK